MSLNYGGGFWRVKPANSIWPENQSQNQIQNMSRNCGSKNSSKVARRGQLRTETALRKFPPQFLKGCGIENEAESAPF